MVDHLRVAREFLDDVAQSEEGAQGVERVALAQAHALIAIAEALSELAARPYPAYGTVETTLIDEHTYDANPGRTLTIDIDTGKWLTPGAALTSTEAAVVAAAVLPGTTPDLVHGWYSTWLSDDPVVKVPDACPVPVYAIDDAAAAGGEPQ